MSSSIRLDFVIRITFNDIPSESQSNNSFYRLHSYSINPISISFSRSVCVCVCASLILIILSVFITSFCVVCICTWTVKLNSLICSQFKYDRAYCAVIYGGQMENKTMAFSLVIKLFEIFIGRRKMQSANNWLHALVYLLFNLQLFTLSFFCLVLPFDWTTVLMWRHIARRFMTTTMNFTSFKKKGSLSFDTEHRKKK